MKQIKVFDEIVGGSNIDLKVNDWIKDNEVDVVDIRHSTGNERDGRLVEFITVVYIK